MAKPNFSIRVEGLTNALKDLDKLKQKSSSGFKAVLHETALNVLRKSQENLSGIDFKDSESNIAQSGYVEISGEFSYEVGYGTLHAPFIEYGTGTEVDVPAGFEAYALQFIGRGIRQVNIKPRPYFHPALNDELKEMRKKLKDLLKS